MRMERLVKYGKLSPGCALCRRGNWLCVYVTDACTRKCEFCSQKKTKAGFKGFRSYITDQIMFDDVGDIAEFLRCWDIGGLGISGGEPLLEADKTIRLIRKARTSFGKRLHIWLYSNGDLLDRKMIRKLAKAGLDELRFDLEARDFELKPVELCKGIIKTVTVEIPAIPEHEKRVIELLPRLKSLGVKYLNLHELLVSRENIKMLKKSNINLGKKKELRKNEVFAAEGSYQAANRIAEHIKRNRIGINVNICTLDYKRRVQTELVLDRMRRVMPS
jgi:pyruvate formate-lyase activating enzyme-like uncharacterized protein